MVRAVGSDLCFETLPHFSADHGLGLGVADDLLGLGVPADLASETSGDACQVASGQSAMVAEDIRDRLFSGYGGFEEVAEVIGQRTVLVGFLQGSRGQWVGLQFVDRFARYRSAVDEDSSPGAFEEMPLRPSCRISISWPSANRALTRKAVAVL